MLKDSSRFNIKNKLSEIEKKLKDAKLSMEG
jgi:hypothetical protein